MPHIAGSSCPNLQSAIVPTFCARTSRISASMSPASLTQRSQAPALVARSVAVEESRRSSAPAAAASRCASAKVSAAAGPDAGQR